jgi:RimJ/RimL family protein N-acetyltransferase
VSRPAYPRLLETPRLALTPAGDADADALHALWNQGPVRRNLWRGHALSHEQSREMAARSQWLHQERGLGLWVAREHGEGALAGFGGYWFLHDDDPPELLYAIDERRCGEGLGGEMVHALVAYGWSVLGLPEICATTEPGNAASMRLLRRLGFSARSRGSGVRGDFHTYRLAPSIADDSWGVESSTG